MATSTAAVAVAPQPEVDIALLDEFPGNPRRHWGDMVGLTASIKADGVIEPLLVRPHGARLQVIAGARRLRAAQAAGLATVPIAVRDCDDKTAFRLAIIENLQRHDIPAMDEALAYEALAKADKGYTPATIAAEVGKDVSYIYRRLKLLQLIAPARELLEVGSIFTAHAERLARLAPAQQKDALHECTNELFRGDNRGVEPAPLSRLDSWIDRHVRIEPTSADAQHYFPEIATEVEAEQASLLQLSESHTPNADLRAKQKGIIGRASWTRITTQKDRCAHVRKGVVVHGGPMRILEVCAEKGCPKHRPAAKKPAPSRTAGPQADPAKEAKAQAKRREEERQRELAQQRRQKVEVIAINQAVAAVDEVTAVLLRWAVAVNASVIHGEGLEAKFKAVTGYKGSTYRLSIKDIEKLPYPTLVQAFLLTTIGGVLEMGYREHETLDAFMAALKVDVKKIDAEVAKEQTAAASDTAAPAKTKAAKKR